jgi:outer membrane protein TolC
MIAFLISLSFSNPLDWLQEQPDETLRILVREQVAQTPDAAIADQRIKQAKALALQRRSAFLPSVAFSLSSNTQPRDALGFGFGLSSLGSIPGMPAEEEDEEDEDTELFTSGTSAIQISVPLDVWGGAIHSHRAGLDELSATLYDKESLLLNLSINIAERYYDVIAARKRVSVVQDQISLTEHTLKITELRHERAEASTLDILQQRQQIASVRAQLPRAKYAVNVSEQALKLLLGLSQDKSVSLSEDFPLLKTYDRNTLLAIRMQRPDIQSAEQRLQAAKKTEYSTMTNMLPRFSLGGQLSRQFNHSTKTEEWDSIDTYAVSTSVSIPLFQGGALWNGYQVSKAGVSLAEISLVQAKLRAEQAIAQQLENEFLATALVLTSQEQLSLAEQSFQEASRLYREGLTPSLNLISTQQALEQAKLNYIQSQRDQVSARLQLYSAFGGISLESSQ